jgi:transposase
MKLEQGEVHLHLAHDAEKQWPCVECGKLCSLYDHQPERRWRHLDTCRFQKILQVAPPPSDCAEHGPRTAKLPRPSPAAGLLLCLRDWRGHEESRHSS